MDLTQLTSADLKELAKLLERKELLQAELADIDEELRGFGNGVAVGPTRSRQGRTSGAPKTGGSAKRGQMKENIIAQLREAGKEGLHVKELAGRLGVKEENVRVWFYTTGKKIKNVKQVAPATYRWEG